MTQPDAEQASLSSPLGLVDCCIVGAGPAGMMLALFLARRGVRVQVLEMHKDFDRDFRGDTVHASTLNVLDSLGLADELLKRPHGKITSLRIVTPEKTISPFDLTRIGGKFPYIAIMPQHDFLNYVLQAIEKYPTFHLTMGAVVTQTLEDDSGHTVGVRCKTATGQHDIHARVVVAADGRFSKIRKASGLPSVRRAPPMDVCWFRVPRQANDPEENGAFYVAGGRMLVCIPRANTWQLGYVFPKGDFAALRSSGIASFRASLLETAPWIGQRVEQIKDMSDLHLLRIESDCLTTWYKPGLLLIGDAAHVMSPVGGVGINAAIADAVATANTLGPPLLAGEEVTRKHLESVQRTRMPITRIIQTAQAAIQSNIVAGALRDEPFDLPLVAKIIARTPGLRRIPPRLFALGVRQPKLTF